MKIVLCEDEETSRIKMEQVKDTICAKSSPRAAFLVKWFQRYAHCLHKFWCHGSFECD